MDGQIFMSYRRDDSAASAGRLYDHLKGHFASNHIFMDVDNLDAGIDFVEAIGESVGSCDVLIAVIGERWLISSDEEGRRRLDNSEDFVRVEIATALKRGIRVIPALVEGASMPRPGDLPDDLKSLVRRNALEVSHTRFRADSERLIGAVERALENAKAEQRQREEKERLEAARREREEKERFDALRRETEEKERLEAGQREKVKPIESATESGDSAPTPPAASNEPPRRPTQEMGIGNSPETAALKAPSELSVTRQNRLIAEGSTSSGVRERPTARVVATVVGAGVFLVIAMGLFVHSSGKKPAAPEVKQVPSALKTTTIPVPKPTEAIRREAEAPRFAEKLSTTDDEEEERKQKAEAEAQAAKAQAWEIQRKQEEAQRQQQLEKATPPDLPASGFFDLDAVFATGPYAGYNRPSKEEIFKAAQDRLKSQKLYHMEADGRPGTETEKALIAFQREKVIPVSGRLDLPTLKALGLQGRQEARSSEVASGPEKKPKPRPKSSQTSSLRTRSPKEARYIAVQTEHESGQSDIMIYDTQSNQIVGKRIFSQPSSRSSSSPRPEKQPPPPSQRQ